MSGEKKYDVAIIGGGLAGLALAIQLSKSGFATILFEKEKYPFHKVCGEYLSFESWNFLQSLELPLPLLNLPVIDTLHLTAPNGKSLTTRLPLGGFGISRYMLDEKLYNIAKENGVHVFEETLVDDVAYLKNNFSVHYRNKDGSGNIEATICCGSYGKRSNLDVKWKRDFLQKNNERVNNYVGIKYHVKTNWQNNVIGLHNFADGYCGISKIEEDKFCLCYMTKASNLKENNNSIQQLQENVLYQNPALKKIINDSVIIKDFPVTISQVSFSKKTQVQNGVLLLGDAAGMITPLCGNGMSMALHSSKIAFQFIQQCLTGKINKAELEFLYQKEWNKQFAYRLKAGRFIQGFFGKNTLTNIFVQAFKSFPLLAKPVIKLTHGKPF